MKDLSKYQERFLSFEKRKPYENYHLYKEKPLNIINVDSSKVIQQLIPYFEKAIQQPDPREKLQSAIDK